MHMKKGYHRTKSGKILELQSMEMKTRQLERDYTYRALEVLFRDQNQNAKNYYAQQQEKNHKPTGNPSR